MINNYLGIQLQVGSCRDNVFNFIPIIFLLPMDTEGANYYCGIRSGPASYNSCRICLNLDTYRAEHFKCGITRKYADGYPEHCKPIISTCRIL